MFEYDNCVVMTTFTDDLNGKKIIDSLLEKRLAACIQVQEILSYYHWEDELCCDREKLVLIKTKKALYHEVEADILANHDYETPEIVQIPITNGSNGYLRWIQAECK